MPVLVLFKPTLPARTALTVPLWASKAVVPVSVSVPICAPPPWKEIRPEVFWPWPPRSSVPPLVVIAPAVLRLLLPPVICNRPPATNVPLLYVFAPMSVSVPEPAFVRLKPAPLMPPTLRLPPSTVTTRLAPRATVPDPMFKLLLPLNTMSAFHTWLLLVERVIGAPLVLSSVPPLIVSRPVPMAEALLMFNSPALSVVPPL